MRINTNKHVDVTDIVKRSSDLMLSVLGMILLSPLLLVLALGVRLSGPGPILFRQMRVGRDGMLFSMLKFRSMVQSEHADSTWTTFDDPRRTRFGRWIRKLSLDELPQLVNVIRGDMSLVGPRPELPFFAERFRALYPDYDRRHSVRPGITGWAQVNGLRGDTSTEKRLAYDLWYLDNRSILLDCQILLRTVFGGLVSRETLRESEKRWPTDAALRWR